MMHADDAESDMGATFVMEVYNLSEQSHQPICNDTGLITC